MLTGLKLGNFKAFGETQNIPIKPITLIFGANSSGKSSIIHGLLMACHANETGDLDAHYTHLGGEAVDLGGFQQYVHRHDINRQVTCGIELTKFPGSFSGDMNGGAASLHLTIQRSDHQPVLIGVAVEADKTIIRLRKTTEDRYVLENIENIRNWNFNEAQEAESDEEDSVDERSVIVIDTSAFAVVQPLQREISAAWSLESPMLLDGYKTLIGSPEFEADTLLPVRLSYDFDTHVKSKDYVLENMRWGDRVIDLTMSH